MKMSKHRTVAAREFNKNPEYVNFVTRDENGLELELFSITRQNYDDFGEPDTLTITIEPGDKLNGETNEQE